MDNSLLPPISPATVNRTVPLRLPNAELRTREHLTKDEVERLIEVAGANRQGPRDALMVLLAFRHGLRASEVCDLRWEQVDFKAASLHVRRTKGGTPSTHPLTGRELRALRRHQREVPSGAFVFTSERSSGSRFMCTCCGMPVASRWRMLALIPGPYRPTSGTQISRTPRDTRLLQRVGSKGFGGTRPARAARVEPRASQRVYSVSTWFANAECEASHVRLISEVGASILHRVGALFYSPLRVPARLTAVRP
jgi:integrase